MGSLQQDSDDGPEVRHLYYRDTFQCVLSLIFSIRKMLHCWQQGSIIESDCGWHSKNPKVELSASTWLYYITLLLLFIISLHMQLCRASKEEASSVIDRGRSWTRRQSRTSKISKEPLSLYPTGDQSWRKAPSRWGPQSKVGTSDLEEVEFSFRSQSSFPEQGSGDEEMGPVQKDTYDILSFLWRTWI